MRVKKAAKKKPAVGRPPLPPGEARTKLVRMRVTEAEHEAVHARATRETDGDVSALLRRLLGLPA